jgi:hypothetical protein
MSPSATDKKDQNVNEFDQFGAVFDGNFEREAFMTIAMNMRTLPFQVAILVSQNHPLRGKAAGNSMRQHLAKMSNKAAEEGLTEADVRRMLHEIPQSNTAFRHSV